jgi:hypothetical protein
MKALVKHYYVAWLLQCGINETAQARTDIFGTLQRHRHHTAAPIRLDVLTGHL